MGRSPSEDLANPYLFDENQPGVYTYGEDGLGKSASGQLCRVSASDVQRDAKAQREAGGDARRTAGNEYGTDDGGHLIGARFGGATGEENLMAQDRNINRGAYKAIENDWEDHLSAGDKVFVNISGYDRGDTGRPTNYQGYAIYEHPDGSRDIEYYSLNNESQATQETWAEAQQAFEAEHLEYLEEERQQNTAMPYHYDEERDQLVENPYYDPNAQEEDFSPTEHEDTSENAEIEAESFEPSGTEIEAEGESFEPTGGTQTEAEAASGEDASLGQSEGATAGEGASADSGAGGSNDSGMDYD